MKGRTVHEKEVIHDGITSELLYIHVDYVHAVPAETL